MKVTDGRVRRLVSLPCDEDGAVRVRLHLPCAEGFVGAAEMRTLLTGDVLVRAVAAGGRRVEHDLAHPPEQAGGITYVRSTLGIPPPSGLTGEPDAHLFGSSLHQPEDGLWIEVGEVSDTAAEPFDTGSVDPLAIRLVLLGQSYRRPLSLTFHDVLEADSTLRAWRARAAEWAHAPARPVPEVFRRRVADALDDDLDTPAVLELLRTVAAARNVPAGAKFGTAAFVDRVLGLDLTRDARAGGPAEGIEGRADAL
ncbi:hypothetical protein [Actinacidiphila guanduensis]|uniref:Uncharacterized protein n=1 Tax=Actinacidiphila guanduensis TaxID=310781 RepID=A0A1H0P9V0_9ACTN|nr:hypothetical protein [Actinacidiphila guanduensis]SDP01751.1 hypothetical protein SAMN05216259_115123 [Actinacidiphila guanduensis]